MFDETSDWDMTQQIIGIVAACSWLVCAVIYAVATFVEWWTRGGGIDATEFEDEYDEGAGGNEYDEGAGENEYDVVKVRTSNGHASLTSSIESSSYGGQSNSLSSFMSQPPNDYEAECEA